MSVSRRMGKSLPIRLGVFFELVLRIGYKFLAIKPTALQLGRRARKIPRGSGR